MKKIIPIILLIALAFISCTANAVNPNDIDPTTWEGIFKIYWNVMNEDYVHFSRNDIAWDDMYDKYLNKFQHLSYDDADDSVTAFKYFKAMAKDITDNHYSLTVYDKERNKLSLDPAQERKWSQNEANPNRDNLNYYPDVIMKNGSYMNVEGKTFTAEEKEDEEDYVDGTFEIGNLKAAGAFHNDKSIHFDFYLDGDLSKYSKDGDSDDQKKAWDNFLDALEDDFIAGSLSYFFGITDTGVAYFYFSEFPYLNILDITEDDGTKKTYKESYNYKENKISQNAKDYIDDFSSDLKFALNMLSEISKDNQATDPDDNTYNVKAIVLDVRSNGGGALEFVDYLLGKFFSSDKVIGRERYKAGYDRYDYTPWYDVKINGDADKDYTNRFAVITNGSSVSCSEITTLAAKEHLNFKQFGSATWGGLCGLIDRNLYQSGPFTLKNSKNETILSIYTTTTQFVANDGTSYEGVGIAPDKIIPQSDTEDNRFKAAIDWASGT